MPYMLTSDGAVSPRAASHRFSDPGSSFSPPKITNRKLSRRASDARSSAINPWNADGVWFSTVTPSDRSSPCSADTSRAVQYGTTTRRPPYDSAPNSSHTEKSKAYEWNSDHTSDRPNRYHSAVASSRRDRLRWLTPTPFGRPVEPEV